jgi:putative transcriptional regulator
MTQNQLQKKIGKRIREIREEKGITQQELATSIKKLRPVVQRIEGGLVNPSIFTIREIAGGLKITLEELLRGLK